MSAAAVEAYAMANGIGTAGRELTEAEKVQARYGLLMDATNKTAGDFANTADGLANTQRIQNAAFEDASAKLGSAFLPIVQQVTAALGTAFVPVIEGLAAAFTWMGENMNIVLPVLAGIAAAMLYLLAPALWAAVTATWAWTVALLANPVTWIVIGIIALVAAIVWLIMNFQGVVDFLADVFKPAIDAVGAVFTWLWENIIKPVVDAISAIFTWVYENILRPIFLGIMLYIGLWGAIFTWLYENIIKPVFELIGKIFEWIYNNVVKPVVDFIVLAIKAMGLVFEWLYKNVIKPVFDNVGKAFDWIWTNVIKPVVDFITGAIESIGEVVNNIFTGISNFIRDTFKGIVNIIRGPVNAVIGFINTLISGLNKIQIKIPDWVPEWGGKTIGFNLAKIPMLADGGNITGSGTVMVGERGPELLNLPRGAQVTPLNKAGGPTIVYNAAPNASLNSETELFAAMRRSKLIAGWG